MPYTFEGKNKKHLPREFDRRRKLSDEQKEHIRFCYFGLKMGVREIAREYEGICSRRAIQFILFPERARAVSQHAKDREQHKKTYARVRGERWASIMREHRRYKKKIMEKLSTD